MTTPRDLERLSAYLDNQLSPAEKAKLESRMAREPDLKAALAELRSVVRAMRSLPTLKPPRSFTLSPRQVPTRARPGGVFPVVRFATALSAVALAVAVIGDWGGAFLLARPAATPAPEVVAQKEVQATEMAEASPAAEVAAAAVVTPTEVARAAVSEFAAADTQAAADAAATGTPEAALAASAATIPPDASGGFPEGTPAPSEPPAEAVPPTSAASTESAVGLTQAAPTPTEAPAAPAPERSGFPPIRYLELGLALLTIVLGLAAWMTRR